VRLYPTMSQPSTMSNGRRVDRRHRIMKEIAHYQLEHAIEVQVSRTFVWNWRTDVRNWDDPPAQFRVDGPFGEGTWGTTLQPGQEPLRWQIREVRPEQSFVVEMPLDGARLSFEWRFDIVSDRRTRVTQRIVLTGDNRPHMPPKSRRDSSPILRACTSGMERIATAMEAAVAASLTH
jgi:hypothetical protein